MISIKMVLFLILKKFHLSFKILEKIVFGIVARVKENVHGVVQRDGAVQ